MQHHDPKLYKTLDLLEGITSIVDQQTRSFQPRSTGISLDTVVDKIPAYITGLHVPRFDMLLGKWPWTKLDNMRSQPHQQLHDSSSRTLFILGRPPFANADVAFLECIPQQPNEQRQKSPENHLYRDFVLADAWEFKCWMITIHQKLVTLLNADSAPDSHKTR